MKNYLLPIVMLLATNALALQPIATPIELQQEAAKAAITYRGSCNYQGQTKNCMVGQDDSTKTKWLLLFTEKGVLYKVVTYKDGKETPRWTHPELMI